MAATATTEIFDVKVEKNPPESKISELGVISWPKPWIKQIDKRLNTGKLACLDPNCSQLGMLVGCQPGKFLWTFTLTKTMYLLEGKVKVYVEGNEGSFEMGAGDLVVFPEGTKVTWDVIETVNKHYSLGK